MHTSDRIVESGGLKPPSEPVCRSNARETSVTQLG